MKTTLSFVSVACLGLLFAYLNLNHGSVSIPTETIWNVLSSPWGNDVQSVNQAIIWNLRLPRIVMAILIGIALSSAGAALQGLFQNPLADPYVLGISSGGSLGAVMTLVAVNGSGETLVGPASGAFVGAAITALVIYRLALTPLGLSLNALLLAGVAVGLVCSALLSLLLLSTPTNTANILGWLMGHLGGTNWEEVTVVLGCTVIGCAIIGANHMALDAMLLGQDSAQALGVDVPQRKLLILSACALLTAGAVAYCGLIGFVGLMVPHAARMIVGGQNRILLPMSACLGAVLLLAADLGARTMYPESEIPVGVITGCCGGLFFIVLLRRGLTYD